MIRGRALAIFGTLLEYYDYALYGFLAPKIAATYLIDASDHTVLVLLTIFAAGAFTKPLGSLIFSHIGDHFGRARALRISMLGMALPTLGMACLPPAPASTALTLLLLLRICQGIFVGGEYDGVTIYIYERFGQTRPCFANSLIGVVASLGIGIAAFMSSVCHDWRLPFFIGGCFGVVLYYLRQSLTETPLFQRCTQPRRALWRVLYDNKYAIATTAITCGVVGASYHCYFTLLPHLLPLSQMLPWCVACYTIALLMTGLIADRLKMRYVMSAGYTLSLVAIGILYFVLQGKLALPWVMVGITAVALIQVPAGVVLLQRFQVAERYRGFSLGHTLGSSLLSGTMPATGFFLMESTGTHVSILVYMVLLITASFWTINQSFVAALSPRAA